MGWAGSSIHSSGTHAASRTHRLHRFDAAQYSGTGLKDRPCARSACFLSASIALCLSAPGAWAGESDASDGSKQLQEIMVIARRREENVQTVPIAITVLSQQTLQDNNVQTLNDLTYLVPSLSGTTNIPNAVRLSLRGQGESGNAAQPGVIMYLNEVPIPNFASGAISTGPGMFFDLESVQVLKGPQGTLFGKNSVGGAILLQTARPTNESGGSVQLSYGNYNDREIDGAVNIPIIKDVLLTRIAFNMQKRDGYTHLLGEPAHPNGIDGDNRDSQSIRATITFRPNESFQSDLIATDSEYRSRGTYGVLVELIPGGAISKLYPNVTALFAQQQALGIRTAIPINVNDQANGYTRSLTNISKFSLPRDITIRNILSFHQENESLAADQDNTVLPFFDVYALPRDQTLSQWTEELQVLGRSFDQHLNWTMGVFWQDQAMPRDWTVENINVFGGPDFNINKQGLLSRAVYAQGTYDLAPFIPGLKFTAGIRYTQDSNSSSYLGGSGVCQGPAGNCGTGTPSTTHGKSHAIPWTVGLDYQLTNDTLLYLTSRRGYRPGGYNGPDPVTQLPNPAYGPEYVTDVEFGVKSTLHVGTAPIRMDADVWRQNYTDIQEPELISQGNTPTMNAGSAHLWGAELEATALLTDKLQLGVTYDHSNLQYRSFNSGVPQGTIAALLSTTTFNNPPNKYGVNLRYRLPMPSEAGNLAVKAVWNWQQSSGDYSVPGGYGLTHAFGLLNGTLDWNGIYGTPLDLTLFASNILDKTYVTQAVPSFEPLFFGYGNEIFGEPRMYGLRVRFHFGAETK